jgi:NADPH:quinone reductase-like Zn-dependent oxidoreductase
MPTSRSRRSLPRFGSEVAGTVEAVGSEVVDLKVGDRVTTVNAFAISRYGMFGETALKDCGGAASFVVVNGPSTPGGSRRLRQRYRLLRAGPRDSSRSRFPHRS